MSVAGLSVAQKTCQSEKRAGQKAARALAAETRVGAATRIAALWRGAMARKTAVAARKLKARRVGVEAAVAAARAADEVVVMAITLAQKATPVESFISISDPRHGLLSKPPPAALA